MNGDENASEEIQQPLKATKAQREVNVSKSFEEMTSKRFALRKINNQ